MAIKPVTPVWRVLLTGKVARFLGFALAVIDALISYKGMRAINYPELEAGTIAFFIAVFQATVAYLLTSGAPIGEEFEARFFSDSGLVGGLRRVIGVFFILICIGFYSADIGSNYAAFVQGKLLPTGDSLSLFKTAFAILAAIALSLGDEMLHLLSDLTDANSSENETNHIRQHGQHRLELAYQRSYMGDAQRLAREQGKEAAKTWAPGRDLKPKEAATIPRESKSSRPKIVRRKR